MTRIVVVVEGGVVQKMICGLVLEPVEVVIVDYDLEADDGLTQGATIYRLDCEVLPSAIDNIFRAADHQEEEGKGGNHGTAKSG